MRARVRQEEGREPGRTASGPVCKQQRAGWVIPVMTLMNAGRTSPAPADAVRAVTSTVRAVMSAVWRV